MQKHLLKKARILKFKGQNLFAFSIHPYLFDPSMRTFMKINCNRIKYTFADFLYNCCGQKRALGFVNLGKIMMSITYFSRFCWKYFSD